MKHQVRNRLRAATQPAHLDLHRHPLMVRLQAPDLTLAELKANASVTCAAVALVETHRARRQLWPELSLAEPLAALRREVPRAFVAELSDTVMSFPCDAALLGALYVVHGSALGGAMLVKAVRSVLPDAPGFYFVPGNPPAWQFLCRTLEGLSGPELDACETGAIGMFNYYGRCADARLAALQWSASHMAETPIGQGAAVGGISAHGLM